MFFKVVLIVCDIALGECYPLELPDTHRTLSNALIATERQERNLAEMGMSIKEVNIKR